ncbi:MAG: helix-turn-helix domain-containing protein [Tetrasphaera sp.]
MSDVAVGVLLRDWRARRRLTQEQLAALAQVSLRHFSCVETGRSRPTAGLVDRLAEHLDVPLRERNHLLLASGFAPRYGARSIDDVAVAPVLEGLRTVLAALLPNPALLLDDCWNVVDANDAAWALGTGCAPELLEPPINIIRLSVHPAGLAPRVRNLAEWASHLHQRVSARAERTGDPALRDLADEIRGHVDFRGVALLSDNPVLALELVEDGQVLRVFGMVAQR